MQDLAHNRALDGADDVTGGHGPWRRCLVTRRRAPRDGMVRFVLDPAGRLTPDLAETLPGRGIWLTARRDMVQTASDKRLFAKAAGRSVDVPAALGDQVEDLLARRCGDTLGLLRRAGQTVSGFQAVREWLRAGRAALLLTAADSGGRDGAELRRKARDVRCVDVLTGAELARGLSREMVVHGAVAPGRLAESLYRDAMRLSGFRTGGQMLESAAAGGSRNGKVRQV